jgi:DNA-binding CsgD family transcriptional regulator/tetratricopeptide (TPR) repeat protein
MADPGGGGGFVGRIRELAQLHGWLAEVTKGAPLTVMLSGDSGQGKSALLARFIRKIAGTATVLSGVCMNLDGSFPYVPLIDALRRWLHNEGEEQVRALAGPTWDGVSRLIADFTGQELVEGALDSKRKVFGAVSRMLEYIGRESPVVLVFEDVQWADQATLDLVAFLTQAAPVDRVMLICTYRPGLPPHHRLREMLSEPEFIRRIHQLPLSGLSKDEIRDLLAAPGRSVDRDRLQRYADLTDGNPYYITQLSAGGDSTDHVPPPLAEILLARVRRLSDDANEVVRVAAVAGRRVTDQLLTQVCNLDAEARERAIQDCLEQAILIFDRPDDAYRFQNPLLRDAIHDSLQAGVRIRVHAAMAMALTADPNLGLSAPLELAYHWFEARDWSNALAAGVKAGAFAAQVSAFPAAETHYTRVLELWSRVPDPERVADSTREQVLFAAADAARWAGHIDLAVSRLKEAIAEVDPVTAPRRAAKLYERIGSYLWEANASGEESQDAYRKAYDLLLNQPPSAIRARTLAAVATGSVRSGAYAIAYRQADRALTEARAVGARAEEGRALNSAGLALTMLGQFEDGIASLRESVRIADEVGHLEDLLRAYGNLGLALEHAGRLAESVSILQQARARVHALELFHTRQSGVLANNLSANLVLLGEWDAAVELLDEILMDRPVKESVYQRLTRAEIHVARGRFDEAQGLLDEIRSEPGTDPRFVGPLYSCMAELALWQEQPQSAWDVVGRGVAAIAGAENNVVRLQLYAIGLRAAADQPAALRDALTIGADEITESARQITQDEPASRDIAVMARLCEAERARFGVRDTEQMWAEVAADWSALSRPYPAAYARWRQVESGIRARHKPAVASVARTTLAEAEHLGAAPLATCIAHVIRANRLGMVQAPVAGPSHAEPAAEPRASDEFGLTDRELQVLELATNGEKNDAIGRRLGISGNTVGVHLNHIYAKLGVAGRAKAIGIALKLGFFP